jgi:ATP-utilising chromatin assembly and remodelling N-terminal
VHISLFQRQAAKVADQAFPEALKEPVLRKIQFSTISRLDHLVEHIYEVTFQERTLTLQHFKTDYYPGEALTATVDGFRCACLIREKTKFNALFLKDGTVRPALSRYRIEITTNKRHGLDYEQNVESHDLQRDRNSFNKALIRAFIKNSCYREAWNGAPWLVKERYARQFRIDMSVPEHLRQKDKSKIFDKDDGRKGSKKKVYTSIAEANLDLG